MPNIKSAKKRVLVNEKKNAQNRSHKSEVATAIKKFKAAALAANLEEAEKLFPTTVSIIDSAASKGVIHPNNAARKVSAISCLLRDLKAGKITAPEVVIRKKAEPVKKAKTAPKAEAKEEAKAEEKVEAKAEKPAKKAAKPAENAEAKEKPVKKAKTEKAAE